MSFATTGALVSAVFGVFGFFLGFSFKGVTNIILFGIFTYACFKAFDYLGVGANWTSFHELINTLSLFGKTILDLMGGMLNTATFLSTLCFLCGGVFGLMLRK
jgi:hypothetical protein